MKMYEIAGLIKIYATKKEVTELQDKTYFHIVELQDKNKKFDYIFECNNLIMDTLIIDDIMLKNVILKNNNNNITDKDYTYTTKMERFKLESDYNLINRIIDDTDKISKFVEVIDDFMLATNLNLNEVKTLIFKIQTEPVLNKLYMTDKEYADSFIKLCQLI